MTSALERALAASPTTWRLALGLYPGALEVVAHSPADSHAFMHRTIAISADAGVDNAKALEEAVYATPMLLSDFGRIHCVVASRRTVVAPAEAADDADVAEALMQASFPGWSGETIVDRIPASNAVILTGVDRGVAGFLRRTFFNATVTGTLATLARYFLTTSRRVNTPRILVNLRGDSLDIVGVDRGRLLIANTFSCVTPDDAVYYILAARHTAGMDSSTLLLCGDSAMRERLMPLLRRFVADTLPVIFPSEMFRAGGREAMDSPFELIVIPLCE